MNGFGVFLAKEFEEIRRTWRIWVIPGMAIFFALTGPYIALVTPKLLASLAGQQPGMVIKLPDPTARDAFGQFLKNLSQIVLIAIVITGAGAVSGERASGTAVLALTKPLSRGAFVVTKVVSQSVLVIVSTAAATAITIGMTALLFHDLPVRALVHAVSLWLVFALLMIGVMTFFSVLLHSRGGAAGAGLAFLFSTLLVAAWPPVSRWSFAGLPNAMGAALLGLPTHAAWPIGTAIAALLVVVAGAVAVFERQEL